MAGVVPLVDQHPWLRQRLVDRLGEATADGALALAGVAANGLTLSTPALLVDVALRSQSMRAERARRETWAGREPDLLGPHRPPRPESEEAAPRPVPLPPGPVERWTERAATGSLLAAGGVPAATRSADLAGRALLVGVPRAAHAAREAFADQLGVGLSSRGVFVAEPPALRRLDRLTCVVVQSTLLHGERPLVVEARPTVDDWPTERVWRHAQRLLHAHSRSGWRLPGEVLVALEDVPAAYAADGAAVTRHALSVRGPPAADIRPMPTSARPVTLAAAGAMFSGVQGARSVARLPDPVPVWHTPWHALEPEEVLDRLPEPDTGVVTAGDDEQDGSPVRRAARSLVARPAPEGNRRQLGGSAPPAARRGPHHDDVVRPGHRGIARRVRHRIGPVLRSSPADPGRDSRRPRHLAAPPAAVAH